MAKVQADRSSPVCLTVVCPHDEIVRVFGHAEHPNLVESAPAKKQTARKQRRRPVAKLTPIDPLIAAIRTSPRLKRLDEEIRGNATIQAAWQEARARMAAWRPDYLAPWTPPTTPTAVERVGEAGLQKRHRGLAPAISDEEYGRLVVDAGKSKTNDRRLAPYLAEELARDWLNYNQVRRLRERYTVAHPSPGAKK